MPSKNKKKKSYNNRRKIQFYRKLGKQNINTQRKIIASSPTFTNDIHSMTSYIKKTHLPPKKFNRLKKWRKCINCILKDDRVKGKKNCILKALKGGFLGSLVPIIASLATPLLAGIFKG